MKNLYNMELHEVLTPSDGLLSITRVPGGWIYMHYQKDHSREGFVDYSASSIFVPFHNEFNTEIPEPTPIPSDGEPVYGFS